MPHLKEDAKVRLEVMNFTGKTIELLVNESRSAGIHTLEYSSADLSSGIYFYRLTVGNETINKKMIIE